MKVISWNGGRGDLLSVKFMLNCVAIFLSRTVNICRQYYCDFVGYGGEEDHL
jgi:hypothetical protein